MRAYKHTATFVILAILLLILSGCESGDDRPAYQILEERMTPAPTLPQPAPATEQQPEASQTYLGAPALEADAIGIPAGARILSETEAADVKDTTNQFIGAMFYWGYTRDNATSLANGYAMMLPELAEAVRASRHFEALIEDFVQYNVQTEIQWAMIATDANTSVWTDSDGDEILRIHSLVTLSTHGDDAFYGLKPRYIRGDTLVELWLYLRAKDMRVVCWEEYYAFSGQQLAFYTSHTGGVNVPLDLYDFNIVLGRYAYEPGMKNQHMVTDAEKEALLVLAQPLIDSIYDFDAREADWLKRCDQFTDRLNELLEPEISSLNQTISENTLNAEARRVQASSLERFGRVTSLIDLADEKENAYLVRVSFQARCFNNTGLEFLGLEVGIWNYAVEMIAVKENDQFLIDGWIIETASEGPLDIDWQGDING